MTRPRAYARVESIGRRAVFGPSTAKIEVGGDDWLSISGDIGPRAITSAAADLLDIAATVFRAERLLPARRSSNPNVEVALSMPVRNVDRWQGRAGRLLRELLGFLGNARWTITFVTRPGIIPQIEAPEPVARTVRRIALFSGGLDSTCGAGTLADKAGTQLCSFYTRQRTLQNELAAQLGFRPPTQWSLGGEAGRGRSFYYRSFLFLSLAAAVAHSWSSTEILQFENGVLGTALPPVPSLMMTKHAHPTTRERMAALLDEVLGGEWAIKNPFSDLTKRQCYDQLKVRVGVNQARSIADRTQSCWNFAVPRVLGAEKSTDVHCGVCIPCIVRRTANPAGEYEYDLSAPHVRTSNERLTEFLLDYYSFLSELRSAKTDGAFRRVLPAEALDLLDANHYTIASLRGLFDTFGREFHSTFRIPW